MRLRRLTGSGIPTAGWIHGRLVQLHGSNLTGLWAFGDATVAAGVIEDIPARLGGAASNIGGANKCAVTTVNGRQYSSLVSAAAVGYAATVGSAVKSALAVVNITNAPTAGTAWYALVGAAVENMMAVNGVSGWHTNTGFTHYRDGVSTQAISLGAHVYEAVDANCTQTEIRMCGIGSAFGSQFGLIGGIGLVRTLAAIDADKRAAELRLVQRFAKL